MWPLVKESLGFIGAGLLVLPWLRDFHRRMNASRIAGLKASGSLGDLVKSLRAEDETRLARPKPFDLVLTVLGLILLGLGFLIGAILAWPDFLAG